MIQINQKDLEEVNKTFKKLSNIDKSPIFDEFADYIHKRAIQRADKHTKTGALIKSLFNKKRGNTYTIGVDSRIAPYGHFVHWGSKPHEIKPKKRKMLRWANNSKFIFAKSVNHPGYKGDPFLTVALDDGLKKLPQFFERLTKDLK